jgi:hypothetical protein
MARHRYIQLKDGTLVEVSTNYVPETSPDSGILWGDRHYDGLRTAEGVDISTRTKHREYMRAKGVTHSSDFKEEWTSARKQRDDFFTTGGDHKARREAVARALHEAVNGRRK